jgi:hypothetical protein
VTPSLATHDLPDCLARDAVLGREHRLRHGSVDAAAMTAARRVAGANLGDLCLGELREVVPLAGARVASVPRVAILGVRLFRADVEVAGADAQRHVAVVAHERARRERDASEVRERPTVGEVLVGAVVEPSVQVAALAGVGRAGPEPASNGVRRVDGYVGQEPLDHARSHGHVGNRVRLAHRPTLANARGLV